MSVTRLTKEIRKKALHELCLGLIGSERGKALVAKHQSLIDTVTPEETMYILDRILSEGTDPELVKAGVGRIINLFHKSLSVTSWEKPASDHFLYYLMLENAEVKKLMTSIKELAKKLLIRVPEDPQPLLASLQPLIQQLGQYDLHYAKKENILFPYIEKNFSETRCLQLMWAFHDDFRNSLKIINAELATEKPDTGKLNKELGRLFFVVLPLIFREQQIVFPVAMKVIPEGEWNKMMQQSSEIGWCFIEPPAFKKSGLVNNATGNGKLDLGTGILVPEQVRLVLNTIPVDLTYIDEHDEVKYFSYGQHRIFPRTKAIIGRKVQNCHPADSVSIVNRIIDSFRDGTKDSADFWIQQRDRFIFIRYFAVRNEQKEYKGTLEVSQDITGIRQLSGEQRLLEWKD